MPQPIRHRAVRTLIAGSAVAAVTALTVPFLGGTADAATPTKNTTYKDAKVDSTVTGSMKIKIGSSTSKIAKLTLVARCDDGKEKLVLKDIRLTGGSFDVASGPGQSVRGSVQSKHKITGNFRTDLCGFFGGSFTAKD